MSALAALAAQAALPFLRDILTDKLGDRGGRIASRVIDKIATRAGVPGVEALEALAATTPGRVIDAMKIVEVDASEMVGIYLREADGRLALLEAEQQEGGWRSAWRPAGMYIIGFLWVWNAVLLHVANAFWKIALPPMPFNELVQLSGLYMGLYMGGHTAKAIVEQWKAKP